MYTMLKENTLEETFTRTLESFLMKFDWHWKEQLNFMSKTMFSPIKQLFIGKPASRYTVTAVINAIAKCYFQLM